LALIISLLITLSAAAAIHTARRLADGQQQAVSQLEAVKEQVYRQHLIALQGMVAGKELPNDRSRLQNARASSIQALNLITQTAGQPELLKRLRTDLQSYQSAVDLERQGLNSEQVAAAHDFDQRLVEPRFHILLNTLKRTGGRFNAAAAWACQIADAGAVVVLLLATLVIVTLSRRAEQVQQAILRLRMEQAASLDRDPLTGLLNRNGLIRYRATLDPAASATLVMIDLNGLNIINERDGHGAGDAQIKRISAALVQATADQGVVARWGGDEFIVLMPSVEAATAAALIGRVAAELEGPHRDLMPFAHGVAMTNGCEPLERAVAIADARMHEDKQPSAALTGEVRHDSLEAFTSNLERYKSPAEIIHFGLPMARKLLGFDACTYRERTGDSFALCVMDGHLPTAFKAKLEGTQHRAGFGITGQVIAQGITAWSNDYPNEAKAIADWVNLGLKSYIVTPVYQGHELVGLISLINTETWRPITPRVRYLLEAVALRLGHALERVRVLEEMRGTLEGGLFTLGLALEARDLETKGHTERVAGLSQALGVKLGLSAEALESLRQGAYLHDIGKLVVPDSILNKPGKLDPSEWTLMQSHSIRGFEIASRIPSLAKGALEVIHSHHERWDGSGYPDRRAGETIPLLARVFAVCDVYDALLSPRPYKRAWTPAEALDEICSQGGKHFDPAVVRAFLEVIPSHRDADGRSDASQPEALMPIAS
jgi:diguanylate cyclase (GGDEF)-like protein